MNAPRDYAQAAAELGVSQQWLEDATPSVPLPHRKFSIDSEGKPSRRGRGAVRFYDEDLAQIREMFAVRPTEQQHAHAGAPAASTAAPSGPITRGKRAS